MGRDNKPKQRTQPAPTATTAGPGPLVGWIAGWDARQGPLVDFEGNAAGPLPARTTVAVDPAQAGAAVASRQGAVLLFERGDARRPLLVGLLQPTSDTPQLDLMIRSEAADRPQPVARVDGKRVELEGQDEVVLRCGAASITLRRNGKVVIRGTRVVSHAESTNRVRGGSVQIN